MPGPNYEADTRPPWKSAAMASWSPWCIPSGASSRCSSRPPARRRSAPISSPISTSRWVTAIPRATGRARLLEAAGAVDLDRRHDHGVRRHGQPERPPLARRRRRASPPHGAPCCSRQPANNTMRRAVVSAAAAAVHGAGRLFRAGAAARTTIRRAAVGDDRQGGAGVRPRRTETARASGCEALKGQPGADQFLRLVVRAVPDRASAADAPGRAGARAAVRHRLQGPAGGRAEAAGAVRRSVPARRPGSAMAASGWISAFTACRRPMCWTAPATSASASSAR